MKTPDALYEALEAVSDVHEAMIEDLDNPDTTPKGKEWLRAGGWAYLEIDEAAKRIGWVLADLNEREG